MRVGGLRSAHVLYSLGNPRPKHSSRAPHRTWGALLCTLRGRLATLTEEAGVCVSDPWWFADQLGPWAFGVLGQATKPERLVSNIVVRS